MCSYYDDNDNDVPKRQTLWHPSPKTLYFAATDADRSSLGAVARVVVRAARTGRNRAACPGRHGVLEGRFDRTLVHSFTRHLPSNARLRERLSPNNVSWY